MTYKHHSSIITADKKRNFLATFPAFLLPHALPCQRARLSPTRIPPAPIRRRCNAAGNRRRFLFAERTGVR